MSKEIQTVERALAVVEFLAKGEILEWKTLKEVAEGVRVPMSSCHRILQTLVEKEWVEKGPRGWRQGTAGLLKYGEYAKKYLKNLGEKINV
jgi:DNA-binding IclR family transcriptional regulator